MKGQRLRYGGAVAAILLGTLFMYMRPLVCKGAIDYIISKEDLPAPRFFQPVIEYLGGRSVIARNLWIAAIAVVVVTVGSGVFGYLRGRWSAQAAESIAQRLRNRLYDHLQHLPCSYHDRTPTGDLVQRCSSDVETIRLFLSRQVVEIGRTVILLGTGIPLMLWLDVRMALLSLAFIPVILICAVIFFLKIKATFQRSAEAEGKMTSLLQENITGIRVVRAFARGQHEREKFARGNAEYRDRWYRLIKILALYWPFSDLMCITQTGLALIAGAYFVTRGEMGIGTLYAFIAYVGMFIWPIRHMGRVLADLGKALVSLGRVEEIMSAPRESEEAAADGEVQVGPVRGEIAFEHLNFKHTQDAEVLKDVSFTVRPGETLALLGPSGSGKSTLINLLLRLYEYGTGSIRLDGLELKDLPRKHVRSQIGVIMQEPFLYSKSLRENIKLGRSSAQDEEMIEAASSACIHDSIQGFEKGYDTLVGERGVTLSGGQRQRVALARALLKDPPILILDDALSSVDTRTEGLILGALKRRHGHRTTLVIAHRLTTLRHADQIIVLDGGRIVQGGTHETLVREDGMYRRLWKVQSSLEEKLGGAVGATESPPEDPPR
jgi:ATP-binding cassette subfamily B protein